MRRPQDWFRQAELDLESARTSAAGGRFEWACFAAQQAAVKAAKALHESRGTEAWGHSVGALLRGLGEVPEAVALAGAELDKHYIPARYPNAHPEGAPGDLYTEPEARRAIEHAELIIDHVRRHTS